MAELEHDNLATANDFDRLQLSVMPFMEKNIQSLIECVDDLVGEQSKVSTRLRHMPACLACRPPCLCVVCCIFVCLARRTPCLRISLVWR